MRLLLVTRLILAPNRGLDMVTANWGLPGAIAHHLASPFVQKGII